MGTDGELQSVKIWTTRFKEEILVSFRGFHLQTAKLEAAGLIQCSVGNGTQLASRLWYWGKVSDMRSELRELFSGGFVRKEVPEVVFNLLQVAVLLSVQDSFIQGSRLWYWGMSRTQKQSSGSFLHREFVKRGSQNLYLTFCKWQFCCQCRGRMGGRAVSSVPTFQELWGDPPQRGKRCQEKPLMWSRKFGTGFFLLSRKAQHLGQEEGGFVLGQSGVTSFILPGWNSPCQEDSRQLQAPLYPEFFTPWLWEVPVTWNQSSWQQQQQQAASIWKNH